MADLNQETTENAVEETVEEIREPIDPSLQGIQLFYAKNKNLVNYLGGGLILAVAAFCYYSFYYMPEQEAQAANELYWAETYFEKDSFNIALKGGVTINAPEGPRPLKGYAAIADEFGMTNSGNLANYCAGLCCLHTGKFEEAIEYLSKYDGKDLIIAPIALGAIGDCNMELNRLDEAVKYYMKAAEQNTNAFTTPLYLKKAGFTYEQQGNYAEALRVYERIKKEFGRTNEGREIEKTIAKVKTLGNL